MLKLRRSLCWIAVLPLCLTWGYEGSGGSGTLSVEVTALVAPREVLGATVKVTKIEALGEDEVVTLFDAQAGESGPMKLDLAGLRDGVKIELVNHEVAVGTYHELRLYIHEATLDLSDGGIYSTLDGSLKMNHGLTDGLIITFDAPLVVTEGEHHSVCLGFDLARTFRPVRDDQSLTATRYEMAPVVRFPTKSTGEIRGIVSEESVNGLVVVDGAVVYILPRGVSDTLQSIAVTSTGSDGSYAVKSLRPAAYDVRVVKGRRADQINRVEVKIGNAAAVDLVLIPTL